MNRNDIVRLPAHEIARRVTDGDCRAADVTEAYLQNLEEHRNDGAKQAREARYRDLVQADDEAAGKRPKPAIGM